jgi:hypothetical protein
MKWEKLNLILSYLTNTKVLIINTNSGEEIKIEAGTMAIDFSLDWIQIDSGGISPQTIPWEEVSLLTFEFKNGKSLSLAL